MAKVANIYCNQIGGITIATTVVNSFQVKDHWGTTNLCGYETSIYSEFNYLK
jgi:hypothetical protein